MAMLEITPETANRSTTDSIPAAASPESRATKSRATKSRTARRHAVSTGSDPINETLQGKTQTNIYLLELQRCKRYDVEFECQLKVEADSEDQAYDIAYALMEQDKQDKIDWYEVDSVYEEVIHEEVMEIELIDDDEDHDGAAVKFDEVFS
jgi:hypothetical protein